MKVGTILTDGVDQNLLQAVRRGDQRAFERIYQLHMQRVRLAAWRMSRRADWIDDLTNEAWCRAFHHRTSYNAQTPFLVWMTGILHNVYREHCRKSSRLADVGTHTPLGRDEQSDNVSPEKIAQEAEVLAGLNDCLGELSDDDAAIVRLRFFQERTLRSVSQEMGIPESTLRDRRLPSLLERLRRCLDRKKIDFSDVFSAQERGEMQLDMENKDEPTNG